MNWNKKGEFNLEFFGQGLLLIVVVLFMGWLISYVVMGDGDQQTYAEFCEGKLTMTPDGNYYCDGKPIVCFAKTESGNETCHYVLSISEQDPLMESN